jgi:hypothetical protein
LPPPIWHANWLAAGVSAASIMDLQAQLYQAQEAARLAKEGGVDVGEKHARRRAGVDVKGLLGPSNPGVQARDQQDKLHIKVCGTCRGPYRPAADFFAVFMPLEVLLCCLLCRRHQTAHQSAMQHWSARLSSMSGLVSGYQHCCTTAACGDHMQ